MRLVIVESPKKARTIKGFLGAGFRVEASMGHVRDLPPKSLGVDVEREFAPEYVVLPRAQSALASLRQAARTAESVLLATDPDREGEAIAWHLAEALRLPKGRYRRIAFHEISRRAIQAALARPRDLDTHLIDAQQARRVLDRLVGYQLSPLLWRKVQRGTSAGRVQSVAVKLVVDREREITAFVPEEYWTIDVRLAPAAEDGERLGETSSPGPLSTPVERGDAGRDRLASGARDRVRAAASASEGRQSFLARLMEVDGKKAEVPNGEVAGELEELLRGAAYRVRETGQKTVTRTPFPPFTTSTLQQAAGNRLRLAAKRTMAAAQALYEAGLVTYMRTDSVAVSPEAVAQARRLIADQFGPEYVPPAPRHYTTKTKNAQEAHEAIRPVDVAKVPAELRSSLTPDEWRVYELIWQRMVASQMAAARYLQDLAWIDALATDADTPGDEPPVARRFALKAQATTLVFDGWLVVYGEQAAERAGRNTAPGRRSRGTAGSRGAAGSDDPVAAAGAAADDPAEAPANARLPELRAGQPLDLEDVLPAQHFTQPPRRYTEASLVKALEEAGVGRPSTYATVVSTIQDRGYVRLEQRHFVPSDLGFAANDFLVEHFPKVVDVPFTAEMEDSLDEIAGGRLQWTQMLHRFYGPFADTVSRARSAPVTSLKRQEPTSDGALCPECGRPLVERRSQYGPFVGCSGFPSCRYIRRDAQPDSSAAALTPAGRQPRRAPQRRPARASGAARRPTGTTRSRPPESDADHTVPVRASPRSSKASSAQLPSPLTKRVVRARGSGSRRTTTDRNRVDGAGSMAEFG